MHRTIAGWDCRETNRGWEEPARRTVHSAVRSWLLTKYLSAWRSVPGGQCIALTCRKCETITYTSQFGDSCDLSALDNRPNLNTSPLTQPSDRNGFTHTRSQACPPASATMRSLADEIACGAD